MNSFINFHHIKKTGGTSLTAIIKQFFRYGESINSADFNNNFNKNHRIWVGSTIDLEKKNKSLFIEKLHEDFSSKYKFAYGHGNLIRIGAINAMTFTILRYPKDVLFSDYLQMSQHLEHDLIGKEEGNVTMLKLSKKLSFKDFLKLDNEHVAQRMYNPMVYTFAGLPYELYDIDSYKSNIECHLKKAKSELEKMFYVGLTETLDEDMNNILSCLGMPNQIQAQKHNVRSNNILRRERYNDIPDEYIAIDMELYEFAKKLNQSFKKKNLVPNTSPNEIITHRMLDIKSGSDTYNVSEPLIGYGWQERFKSEETVTVWTGPLTESTLHLKANACKDCTLSIKIIGGQDHRQIQDLKVFIDNIECKTYLDSSSNKSYHLIKTYIKTKQSFTLKLLLPFCINPSEKIKGSTDYRTLGLAISSFNFKVHEDISTIDKLKSFLLKYKFKIKSLVYFFMKK